MLTDDVLIYRNEMLLKAMPAVSTISLGEFQVQKSTIDCQKLDGGFKQVCDCVDVSKTEEKSIRHVLNNQRVKDGIQPPRKFDFSNATIVSCIL